MLEEDMGERYRHLLQPLRDISTNWELSIKVHLDEYLEKLKNDRERNAVAEDGDAIRFNFSEAAMLLQGSLQIFARKVDHLYEAIVDAYMGGGNKRGKKRNAVDPDQTTTRDDTDIGHIKNDFELLDEKHSMLNHLVDTRWFLQNDCRKESRDPVKVGQRRDVGKRDRFVDLPISFIPTKKSAPSVHHFQYEQNNEKIYIPQSDLFSFNAIAFSNDDGTDMTVFMSTAYLQLVHSFSPEYIPYLRDEHNYRLRTIPAPYNIDAPMDVYQRLLELDARENRGNESQEFLETYYGNRPETPEDNNFVDLTADLNFAQNGLRPSSVEAPRESVLQNGITGEFTDVRVSDFPAYDPLSEGLPPVETTITATAIEGESLGRSTRLANSSFASSVQTAIGKKLDVDKELEFMDEYADVKTKTREINKDKKKRKPGSKRAINQCKIRDEQLKEKFEEQGKDYEKYRNNLGEYINAKLFSRKLCTFGSVLENLNPSLRSRPVQALNRVLYAQEKYIKAVKLQRKHEKIEIERARRMAEQKRKRERAQMKQLKEQAKRRLSTQVPHADENDENQESDPLHPTENLAQNGNQSYAEVEQDEVDYFGAQPDDDDMGPDDIDDPDPEFNPAILMEQEINEMANRQHVEEEYDDDSFDEQEIFTHNDAPETQDFPLGDNPNRSLDDLRNNTADLGSFATNDPAFFDLEKLTTFFHKAHFDLITDDDVLMQTIQTFWTVANERDLCVPRQRLQNWSAHILERLDEDARHKPFEIHEYGSSVLDAFGGIGSTLPFREVVKGVNKYEISRYLLATLILANCGNVQIINDGKEWDGVGKPVINKQTSLKLLSMQRHHEVFQSEQLLITN